MSESISSSDQGSPSPEAAEVASSDSVSGEGGGGAVVTEEPTAITVGEDQVQVEDNDD